MLVILFVCLPAFCYCQGPQEPGEMKFVINFDSPIYTFGEPSLDFIDTSQVFVERYNESTAFMHGEMLFHKGVGKNTILEIIVLKEVSGKFEVFFSHDVCNFCKELADEASDYRKHLQYFGFPTECPIEPGAYKIHDMTLDMDDIPLSSSHIGRYETQLNLYEQTGENCQTDRESLCVLKMDVMIEEEMAK